MSGSIVPFAGRFLDNASPHNFARLGHLFLMQARFTHQGFKGVPEWPTYCAAFQSLENYLKSYLLRQGVTLDHVRRVIGHKLKDALREAKAQGLVVSVPAHLEAAVIELSEHYTKRDFQYRGIGEWKLVDPAAVIAFVENIHAENFHGYAHAEN